MKLFRLVPDDEGYLPNYYLSAAPRWGLPGVRCDVCGRTGGVVGLQYPHIQLPSGVDPAPFIDRWPVTPARIEELANVLRPLFSPQLPIRAGMDFGPLEGTGSGRFGDFTWVNKWTPLISEDALEKLISAGVARLPTVEPCIKLRSTKPFRHREIVAEPRVHLTPTSDPSFGQEKCPACGFLKRPLKEDPYPVDDIEVFAASFPNDMHVARIYEWPGRILVTEAFKTAVERLKLTDVAFKEVRFVE